MCLLEKATLSLFEDEVLISKLMCQIQFALIRLRRSNVAMSKKEALDDYELIQCIDGALNKFGPGIKYTVYWRMVVLNQSPREGILGNPQAFVEALKSIFGKSAKQIEQAIADEIKSVVGDNHADSLPELISQVRKEKLLVQSMP